MKMAHLDRFTALLIILLMQFLASCQSEKPMPDTRPLPGTSGAAIGQYMKILSASQPHQTEDGRLYYLTWPDGADQLTQLKDGKPLALTDKNLFPNGVNFYAVNPAGTLVVLGGDIGGDEQFDLYLLDLMTPGATPKAVDVSRKVRSENIIWAGDGSFFLYRCTRRNGKDFDVWRYDLASEKTSILMEGQGYLWLHDLNEENTRLAYSRVSGANYSDLLIYDIPTKTQTMVSPKGRTMGRYDTALFNKEGNALWALTNNERAMMSLVRIDLQTLAETPVSELPWDVEALVQSPNRDHLAYAYNEHGYSRLAVMDSQTQTTQDKLDCGMCLINDLSVGNKALVFSRSDAVNTDDIWSVDFTTYKAKQRTFSDYMGVDPKRFVFPELVFYESFDGRKIPAFLYKPKGYGDRPAPYVLSAHGGPESQFRPGFIRSFQYLLEHGVGIMTPNVRGSSGYGREYLALDDYKNRMDSIRDYHAAAQWLVAQKLADPKRLGIRGGSYGGFVVMSMITEYPDLFAAAMSSVGIVNFVSFLENTKGYRRSVREREYGPLSDKAFLESISPIHKIDRVHTPLMVAHGANDPRVPVGEARQVVQALEKNGQDVEELIFPDEGHGVKKLENRLRLYQAMVEFFIRYLKPNPDVNLSTLTKEPVP